MFDLDPSITKRLNRSAEIDTWKQAFKEMCKMIFVDYEGRFIHTGKGLRPRTYPSRTS